MQILLAFYFTKNVFILQPREHLTSTLPNAECFMLKLSQFCEQSQLLTRPATTARMDNGTIQVRPLLLK